MESLLYLISLVLLNSYGIVNCSPVDFLLRIFLLFEFKNVFVEVKMQIFISVINAKLFEAIFGEILETKNVKNWNRRCLFRAFVNNVINSSN